MRKKHRVSVCKGDVCVNADGDLAKGIAGAAIFALICTGIAKLFK